MVIKNQKQLIALFERSKQGDSDENNDRLLGRHLSKKEFYSLESVDILYGDYIEKESDGTTARFMFGISQATSRVYAMNINHAGHGVRFEVLPITLSQILTISFVESLFDDFGRQISLAVDRNASYQV